MNKTSSIIDFTLIYNLYKKPLYNYVWKMMSDKNATEDIVQIVFLKFYENLSIIKQANKPNLWLFTTARNEVFGFLRKKNIRRENYFDETLEYASEENLSGIIEDLEIKEIIEREIESMDEEAKEIFILREYSGLSYREIANVLGINETIVKGRLFRSRQKLIDKISKLVR
ncbi:MAG: RNA polymerase sigma factor [Ignavibacteriaceae bacterium]